MSEDNFEDMDGALFDGLSELEKMERGDELIALAFNNSYNIITKKVTFDELLDNDIANNVEYTVVMHDVEAGFNKETIEVMIDWYVESEEYEKCATLHEMIKD